MIVEHSKNSAALVHSNHGETLYCSSLSLRFGLTRISCSSICLFHNSSEKGDCEMLTHEAVRPDFPQILTDLPGPRAKLIIDRDARVLSPSYTRCYPLVVDHGEGAIIEDVDGNRFLDFNAGIAVVATGHCHPRVVEAVQRQAASLIHMSGTDFYYENLVELAETLVRIAPGGGVSAGKTHRVYFGNYGE